MISITLPSFLENVPEFLDAVRRTAEEMGFNEKQIMEIELSCEEVLTNIVDYAYKEPGNITLEIEKIDNGIKMEVIDSGMEFDITKADDPDIDIPLEDRIPGGLGIFLTKKMMDEVVYKREDNLNRLVIIKYLN